MDPKATSKTVEPVATPGQSKTLTEMSAEEFVAWAEQQPATHHLSVEEGRELLRQMALQRQSGSASSLSDR